jgi:tRNA(Ile)-lysidine synthase
VPVLDLLLEEDCQKLQGFERLWVGFSAGLDSTVLLHALMQDGRLKDKIQAIHVHHGLSNHADEWEADAQLFCKQLGIPLTRKRVSISSLSNLEEEARKARYGVFRSLLKEGDALILAHHRDDQAETVLLQLFRGAGIDGLSAMPPYKPFANAVIVRPLLHCSRKTLEAYAHFYQLPFVTDESNADSSYSRNFLRNQIIPELEKKWPGVQANLARTARHCTDTQTLLRDLAKIDYDEVGDASPVLYLEKCKHLSFLRIKNILRNWLKVHAERLPSTAVLDRVITDVITAAHDKCPEIVWDKYQIRRFQEKLYLLTNFEDLSPADVPWTSFPNALELPQGLGFLHAISSEMGLMIPEGSKLVISFRKGGEEIILRGQRKSLKKLFQEWQIPPWLRGQISLLYINDELAAVIGYAVSDVFYGEKGAYIIQAVRHPDG